MKSETLPKSAQVSRQTSQHYYDECTPQNYISTSCPESWQHEAAILASSSLPDKLEMERPFFKALKKPKITRNEGILSFSFF